MADIRVGEYTVSVQPPAVKMPNESDTSAEEIKAKIGTMKSPDPANIPKPMRATQTSPLKATVAEGDNAFNFDLAAPSK
jgi:hypothetical protein